jgi:hypothetical protein
MSCSLLWLGGEGAKRLSRANALPLRVQGCIVWGAVPIISHPQREAILNGWPGDYRECAATVLLTRALATVEDGNNVAATGKA